MKRHIYLRMKPVEEARETFLSRFDLPGLLLRRSWPRRGP